MLFAAESGNTSTPPLPQNSLGTEKSPPADVNMSTSKKLVQYEQKIGYWKDKAENCHFVTLGNFGVRLLKFVQAPKQLPDYIGFVVQVSQNLKRGRIDAVKEG